MLSESNFLILDEPTNHLDITSKEILEDALNAYEGTVLYVSHDRYFINRTASRILDLCDGKLVNYLGDYNYYLEKKAQLSSLSLGTSGTKKEEAVSETKLDWRAQKEAQAKQRKQENDLRKCEEAISSLEKSLAEIDAKMSLPEVATDVAKLQELVKSQEELNAKLVLLYDQWESLIE